MSITEINDGIVKRAARKATAKTPAKPVAKKAAAKPKTHRAFGVGKPAEVIVEKRAAKPAAKKAAAKAVEPKAFDAEKVAARIKALRAEGVAWRPLSATLNAEGIRTVRGATWSANGSSAFRFATIHGVK